MDISLRNGSLRRRFVRKGRRKNDVYYERQIRRISQITIFTNKDVTISISCGRANCVEMYIGTCICMIQDGTFLTRDSAFRIAESVL